MVSYAQNAEDVVLHRALCSGGVGRYVDVGASFSRRRLGDEALLRPRLERNRRGASRGRGCGTAPGTARHDIVVEAALGAVAGEITIYVVDDERGLSSTDVEVGTGYGRAGRPVRERVVALRTLADVLDEHCDGDISFLKVDVEGAEAEVLSGNDWTRWRPRVVLVEATKPWSHHQTHASWEPQLLAAGYLFASFDGINRYYARAEEPDLIPLLSPASELDNFVPENTLHVERYIRHLEAELERKEAELERKQELQQKQEVYTAQLEARFNGYDEELRLRDRELARNHDYIETVALQFRAAEEEIARRGEHMQGLGEYTARQESVVQRARGIGSATGSRARFRAE